MESYKCNVCAKSFTGLVCFQQHEASEKHKKKVWLMNGANFDMLQAVNLEQFHCPVCMVSIAGLDNYQKHVISLDHALKVQKKNGDLLSQSVSSTFELKTEQNQLMESSPSPVKVSAFTECIPCQKQFSGPEPYQQHLVSAGHKKKCGSSNEAMQNNVTHFSLGNEKINNNFLYDPQFSAFKGDPNAVVPQPLLEQSVSSTFESKTEQNQPSESTIPLISPIKAVVPYAECTPCQKQFSGPEPYQQHLVSAGHKKKCGYLNEILQSNETDSSVGNEMKNNNLHDSQASGYEDGCIKVAPKPFAKCDICKMQFNGALPYNLHIVSDDHKKKAGKQSLENSFVESQNAFKCDVCVMKFSGPVPYQQHLVSIGHKKKINAAELSKLVTSGSLSPLDSTLKDEYLGLGQYNINDLQKWYCGLCKKQCSGPIPYNTHILSRDHSKNLRILEVEKNLRKMKELGSYACFGNDEVDSEMSNKVRSTANFQSKFESEMQEPPIDLEINDLNINVKREDTKILSEKFHINQNDLIASPGLNIIPPENLDVNVFHPDDEIVFSSPLKCRQEAPLKENNVKEMCNKKFSENNCLMLE